MNINDNQIGGSHYIDMTVRPWQAMESWMTDEQFKGFLLGSIIAYLARFNADAPGKGGIQDILKAHHYLQKLLDVLEYGKDTDNAQ